MGRGAGEALECSKIRLELYSFSREHSLFGSGRALPFDGQLLPLDSEDQLGLHRHGAGRSLSARERARAARKIEN